jgi:hypothetical protein
VRSSSWMPIMSRGRMRSGNDRPQRIGEGLLSCQVRLKPEKAGLLRPRQSCDKTSAVGAAELSPALQRWVGIKMDWSAVGTTGISCAVPTGLGTSYHGYPALKRWAKIFRPASGTASFAMHASFLTRSSIGKSAFCASFLIREGRRKLSVPIGPAMRPV